ncbi:MAG: prepilin-type N-terminal cleavage/methylation domain-containing protein [Bacteroidetes bacterium]|nr:prepilin-type N-terminal cleavage/methylation domain-containing protein [Bacteroidota bacterium]HET6243888.1 prepilin-type N-terminal cleavage/methylation domain-containing protein [Bacteroidia bacterium]
MIKKVKAFTIIELVVVMILTSIVVGIVYSSYSIVGNQFYMYKKTGIQNSQVALLKMLLNKDFTTSQTIKKGNNELFFYQENNLILYGFGENFITRNSNAVKDTFAISPINIDTRFLNQVILNNNDIVDELYFEAEIFKQQQVFQFKKQYAADVLIENESEQK